MQVVHRIWVAWVDINQTLQAYIDKIYDPRYGNITGIFYTYNTGKNQRVIVENTGKPKGGCM